MKMPPSFVRPPRIGRLLTLVPLGGLTSLTSLALFAALPLFATSLRAIGARPGSLIGVVEILINIPILIGPVLMLTLIPLLRIATLILIPVLRHDNLLVVSPVARTGPNREHPVSTGTCRDRG